MILAEVLSKYLGIGYQFALQNAEREIAKRTES